VGDKKKETTRDKKENNQGELRRRENSKSELRRARLSDEKEMMDEWKRVKDWLLNDLQI
jgi:hypothetical protein